MSHVSKDEFRITGGYKSIDGLVKNFNRKPLIHLEEALHNDFQWNNIQLSIHRDTKQNRSEIISAINALNRNKADTLDRRPEVLHLAAQTSLVDLLLPLIQ